MKLFLARFFSVLFLPIFIPVFSSLLLVWSNEYAFGGWNRASYFILQIFFWTCLIPGVALLIMKQLGLIADLSLSDKKDRIIPYFVIIICYSIAFYAIKNLPDTLQVPNLVKAMLLGSIGSIIVSFFLNNFLKVSAHANGMGSLVGVTIGVLALALANLDWMVWVAVFLSGIVASSRLYLKAHTIREVMLGFALGLVGQLVAFYFFGIFNIGGTPG